MNLKGIRRAVAAYQERLDEVDQARLDFFGAIWETQARLGEEFAARGGSAYELPSADELRANYKALQPVFMVHPCPVDKEFLAAAAAELRDVFCDGASYPTAVEEGLRGIDWTAVLADPDGLAGRDPSEWLLDVEAAATQAADSGGDADEPDETASTVGRLAALIASMALKVQLEGPAAEVMAALDGGAGMPHATLCPVCGSSPMMAHVGGPTSSDGRGRLLVCPQCGATWEFERVRCARCGTRHESALHYFHLEGDDSHRIATCDECGGYIRTLFSERDLLPVAYEVEDVVMAKLDAIAAEALEAESSRI